jgi:hypothetical protein
VRSSQLRFRPGRFCWKHHYSWLTKDICDLSSSYRIPQFSVKYRSGPRDTTPTCVEHSEVRQIHHPVGRQSATSNTRTTSNAKNAPDYICIPLYQGRTQAPSATDAKRECWNEGKTICSTRKSHSTSAKLGVAEDIYLPLSLLFN